MRRFMQDNNEPISSAEGAITQINCLTRHHAELATISDADLGCNTMKGIKSYYKFIANKQNNRIFCFTSSAATSSTKYFAPQNVQSLDCM